MYHAPRQGLVGEAYARLKTEIRSGRLAPGFQATEPEFARRLGMSRTPVREALIRLEAEGLVELIPRHGARVVPLTPGDMAEIYEILIVLEPEVAANVAAMTPGPEALAGLREAAEAMEAAIARDNLDAWAEADDRFHLELLTLNGNGRVRQMVTTLFDQAHRARMVTLRMRERPVRSTAEHREILELIAAGDADGARALFAEHRRRAAAELLALMQKYRLTQL